MYFHRSFADLLRGTDAGVHRLLRYWALGQALYAVSLSMLWFAAWLGVAPRRETIWLTAASLAGSGLAYLAIRASVWLGLPAALLNTVQCLNAIACVIAAYALVGPMRGVTLCILVVVLVFGGFSATSGQIRAMCAFAVGALAVTVLWKSQTEPERYPPQQELVHFVLAAAMLIAVAYLAELLSRLRKKLKDRTQELADALARILELATRDDLTQLMNRRRMTETLRHESARHERAGETMCIALIDIDHFKRVNDTRGHAAGDAVLKCFAEQALASVRRSDILARWGGEEFLLLLPATRLDAARAVLERMRAQVRESVRAGGDPATPVTFSAGLIESSGGESIDAAIDRADQAMYRAKHAGRDRTACVPAPRAAAAAAAA